MLLELKRSSKTSSGADERTALESGIAEAQNSIEQARGSENADLRATLAAFIAQCERRIAEIGMRKGR